jgi:phage virion morphogenesis protein
MIKIDVLGQPRLEQIINAVDEAIDPTHILDEGAAILLARNLKRFLQQVDPDGVPWIPSKAAEIRAKKGRGGGTLFDTGNLFHSIQLARSTVSERFIGTDVPYGRFHQFGKPIARPFLGINEEDIGMLNKLVIKRLKEKLSGIGES